MAVARQPALPLATQKESLLDLGLLRASPQLAETAVPNTLQSVVRPNPVPLHDLFNGEQYEDGRELNDRELEVVAAATAKRRKTKSGSESQGWVIDVSKS